MFNDPGQPDDRLYDPTTPGYRPPGPGASSSGHDNPLEHAPTHPSAPAAASPDDPARRFRRGDVLFGKYVVERFLGLGGMGSVWLVRHLFLGEERALKLIVAHAAFDARAKERFRVEAKVTVKFSGHPNAILVHDALIADDAAYLEMEYIRGRTLSDVLKERKRLPLDLVHRLLVPLCDVLHEAHARGIIHRDLSPSNLMLLDGRPEGQEHLKVMDFGIAKILAPEGPSPPDEHATLTDAGSFIGKPAYASPEQIQGKPLDGRSDLYSVGVMLFEFLTGSRPFRGTSIDLYYQQVKEPPPTFAEVGAEGVAPPAIEAVVRRCLAKDPAERPRTARDLARAFAAALPGGSPAVPLPKTGLSQAPEDERTQTPGDQPKTEPQTGWRGEVHPGEDVRTVEAGAEPQLQTEVQPIAAARRWWPWGVGIASVLGVAALAFGLTYHGGPKPVPPVPMPTPTPTPVPPPVLADHGKQVAAWEKQGYRVGRKGDATTKGWPATLVRKVSDTEYMFSWTDRGIYVPEGYAPGPEDAADGKPKTLVVKGREHATLVRVPGGTFEMGCLREHNDPQCAAHPRHQVELSGFYIGKYEVANDEFAPFAEGLGADERLSLWRRRFADIAKNEATKTLAGGYPAERVDWDLAALFARRRHAFLPTEAQWEYAARSGGKPFATPWAWNESQSHLRADEVANIQSWEDKVPEQQPYAVEPVGKHDQDATNQGVLDMGGNVWEWCRDAYEPYSDGARKDPEAPPESPSAEMVLRGFSGFDHVPDDPLTTSRRHERRGKTVPEAGFRLVVECPEYPAD